MTTVIGVLSREAEMAILCADRQATIGHAENRAIPVGKASVRKLWTAKNGMYSFGYSGPFDDDVEKFAARMVDGSIDVERVTINGSFPELRELNLDKLGDEAPEAGNVGSFLLITRFGNEPSLYKCWPLGKVALKGLDYIG
ncbi:MAG: hypothetical protein AABX10_03435, partial [Nanoarchaeota archaeon]